MISASFQSAVDAGERGKSKQALMMLGFHLSLQLLVLQHGIHTKLDDAHCWTYATQRSPKSIYQSVSPAPGLQLNPLYKSVHSTSSAAWSWFRQ